MNVSAEVALKAARLNEEGRVTALNDFMYRVEGEHGTYTVAVGHAEEVSGNCTCPAKWPCSHGIAACAFHLTLAVDGKQARHLKVVDADPYAGIVE